MKIIIDEKKKEKKENALDTGIIVEAEKKYDIKIKKGIVDFWKENSGGIPIKSYIMIDKHEYEVRRFLSLNKEDNYYGLEKPLDFFLSQTKGKIVPIGVDSGDNYYCVNNETGKVYYWRASVDEYYCVAKNINEFSACFVSSTKVSK